MKGEKVNVSTPAKITMESINFYLTAFMIKRKSTELIGITCKLLIIVQTGIQCSEALVRQS